MTKEYREIKFPYGCNIEAAVLQLIEHNKRNELVSGDFNGHMLYSDTVTVDGAYLEIVGVTKAEFDRSQKEWKESLQRRDEEHKARIPELTVEWIKRGHSILDEEYWPEWDRCVPIRLNDLYKGMELGNCLSIVDCLNKGGTLDSAKEILENQGHSNMSFALVRAMLVAFCKRGKEFAEYIQHNRGL